MKSVKIIPSLLNGQVRIPPSKSMSHRAIIGAGLSEGTSHIDNIAFSDDIIATLEGIKAFGVMTNHLDQDLEHEPKRIAITGNGKMELIHETINCKESGSTLRFLIPMAGLIEEKVTFIGKGKLVERPLNTYYEIFKEQNIAYTNNEGKLPLSIIGRLKPGIFKIKGNVSSQFITGLLFVLPLLDGDSKMIITTPLESKGYVDLTLSILERFSIKIENNNDHEFIIKGNQKYRAQDYRVEGDFSQAAFWIVAGLLGGNIQCSDLNMHSLQGDKAILDIVKKMGANLSIDQDTIQIEKSDTKGITIDASQCPDLVPILATLGALSKGTTKIINAARLRIKESDRLKAMATELNKLGADVKELEEGLEIHGKEKLKGGTVDSWNDHRIAMALAMASIKCSEPVIITNSHAVSKSYPTFWQDFEKTGGKIDEWHMGE
ncbi:3-phosphoshikimate 1-carboxyvinyltransferase [Marinisporobacter balticus]|uniref:3-phosphoshikimate 1-carboxyvinyltransferase n=1 Tax=Marinisporobacter balticus TaxID=2018667 RepID=A0A4R2KJI4_9FIRM|nr:3-phosphoshikimate 1-carboxyvinyltransferase [Marinisporobacter balticus]TCO73813.1 3-phosphoshikimate 1-carboxyvinyltransferase [Marinisporobacter balticus]